MDPNQIVNLTLTVTLTLGFGGGHVDPSEIFKQFFGDQGGRPFGNMGVTCTLPLRQERGKPHTNPWTG